MGPLVYYCRWHGAKLRLQGRDEQFVWGQLVTEDKGEERAEPFRFNTRTWELLLGEGDERRALQLDELGVVIEPEDRPPPTTTTGASPQ